MANTSTWGPEFDAAMKELRNAEPPEPRMVTWYCREDGAFHVLVGKPGCKTCPFYEARV